MAGNNWKDFYNVPGDEYVHSRTSNFEYILNKNNIKINDAKGFGEEILEVVIKILQVHLDYWNDLRKLFIKEGIEQGFFQEGDSNETCLKKWNKVFNNQAATLKELENFNVIYDTTETVKTIGRQKTKRVTEKIKSKKAKKLLMPVIDDYTVFLNETEENYINYMLDQHDRLIKALISLYNGVVAENSNLLDFVTATKQKTMTYKDKELKKGKKQIDGNLKTIFSSINAILYNLSPGEFSQGKGIEILKDFQRELSKVKSPEDISLDNLRNLDALFTAIGRQTPTEYINNVIKTHIPNAMGSLLEIVSEKVSEKISPKTTQEIETLLDGKSTGEFFKDVSVSDTFFYSYTNNLSQNERKIYFGASVKAVRGNIINRSYSTEKIDFLNSKIIEHKDVERSSSFKVLQWLRANIASLETFNVDNQKLFKEQQVSSKQKTTTSDIPLFKDYIDLETDIAALMILPRVFDGFFDYQEEVTLKEFNGSQFHTALINISGGGGGNVEFVWIADIFEKLLNSIVDMNSLRNNKAYTYKAQSKDHSNSVIKIGNENKSTLESNWKIKQARFKELQSKGKYITYENLKSDPALQSAFKDIYNTVSFRNPVGMIYANIKLLKLIK